MSPKPKLGPCPWCGTDSKSLAILEAEARGRRLERAAVLRVLREWGHFGADKTVRWWAKDRARAKGRKGKRA